MKRRLKAFLMAFVMLFTVLASAIGDVTVAKADELVVKLHYNRPDGAYDGWSVWFWAENSDGVDTPFAEENGEMVATFSVAPGTAKVGYIVRTAEWEKDVAEDQWIDVLSYLSGTVHVYVESGVKGHTVEPADDVTIGIKLVSAEYDLEKNQITAATTGTPEGAKDNDFFAVSGTDGTVNIESVTLAADNTYIIKLADELDPKESYKITFLEDEYDVTMPDFYSTEAFEEEYTYTGDDLGATWSKESTTFKVWAPLASAVRVNLYKGGSQGTNDLIEQIDMKADEKGTWVVTKEGDLNGVYYTYTVTNSTGTAEVCDPYARTTGVNGKRAMIIDLDSTDPEGWEDDTNPHAGETINDAVIYELHIRDLGTDESSGIENAGKYLSLTEHGTKTESGISTGVDHLKDLGITHLHILPMYDYGSVNETQSGQFNWGYDPVNYNVPEGSYSTDPFHGEVRVNEVKQMVQSLHKDGISVVMDVVYNHVYNASEFCFNQIVPGYFSRPDSNGSGCGNDTASERSMVSKYIVDSVKYWADEYHIDGFRFDLVGLIDTETINAVIEEVHKTHPDVIFYGEGWTMNTAVTKDGYAMTTQTNSTKVPEFAFFNDTLRDALKGSVFSNTATGYVTGALGQAVFIQDCFLASASWCKSPSQTISYASCHDNNTLYDRIQASRPDASYEDQVKMNNLSAAIYMTSQGVPFIHAGEEMLRTKVKEDGTFDHNSYASSDEINSLKWDSLDDETYMSVYEYYKGLIAFRKAHAVLRLTTAEDVAKHVSTVSGLENNVLGFILTGDGIEGETAHSMYVAFNPNETATTITLPEGEWNVYVQGDKAGTEVLDRVSGTITVDAISTVILVQEDYVPVSPLVAPIVVGVVAVVAIIGVSAAYAISKRKAAGL